MLAPRLVNMDVSVGLPWPSRAVLVVDPRDVGFRQTLENGLLRKTINIEGVVI